MSGNETTLYESANEVDVSNYDNCTTFNNEKKTYSKENHRPFKKSTTLFKRAFLSDFFAELICFI